MSGHSHWRTIKYKKGAADEKKAKLFGKLAKVISIAAREKGGDPEMNPRLRIAIEVAHKANMPKDNIERAIKKGTGGDEGARLEEITLEAYGPEGTAIMIECITDNKNRTISDVKTILSKNTGKLASEGSVKWMFSQKGALRINMENQNKEDAELKAIDAGADDLNYEDNQMIAYTPAENIERMKQKLENSGLTVESADIEWVPQNPVKINNETKERIDQLFEALDEYDDVQETYSNTYS